MQRLTSVKLTVIAFVAVSLLATACSDSPSDTTLADGASAEPTSTTTSTVQSDDDIVSEALSYSSKAKDIYMDHKRDRGRAEVVQEAADEVAALAAEVAALQDTPADSRIGTALGYLADATNARADSLYLLVDWIDAAASDEPTGALRVEFTAMKLKGYNLANDAEKILEALGYRLNA